MNEVIVSMNDISKNFPGVKALDKVHFELRSGEVMALLGENGAGKSTLMKILSGVYTRDGGTMEIFGKSYDDLTPKQAQEAGVAIIHQELNMCKHLSVAENMFLGREMVGKGILDNRKMRQEAKNILNELKIDIDPDQTVGDLPVSKQQMVEIAKALSIHAKILIMDEPTSALTAREIEDLFRIIKDLKAQGCGIVYISHRLEELAEIVDRVTIMRDGLCTKLSIRQNLALPNLDIICNKLGVIRKSKEDELCAEAVQNLRIKTPNIEVDSGNLSGGNQQKVVVGKWLARNSRVVIFDEPTRGIDVGAKVEIYNLMNDLKKQGIAVMFVSSEMPEVMGIADRIIVMCDGRITGELMANEASQSQILTMATAFEKKKNVG
mgnify:CR=1 FL=1